MNPFSIFLPSPPEHWYDAFPFGTGRIAATLAGTHGSDLLLLNHEKLWTRVHTNRRCAEAAKHMPAIRALLRDGKSNEAMEYLMKNCGSDRGNGDSVDSYQPAGEIAFRFISSETGADYCRELDLADGTARVFADGIERVYAADFEADRITGEFTSSAPFTLELTLSRQCDPENPPHLSIDPGSCSAALHTVVPGGLHDAILVRWEADSAPVLQDGVLVFSGLTHFRFQLNCGCGETGKQAENESFFAAVSGSVEDCRAQYRARVERLAALRLPASEAETLRAFAYARHLFLSGTENGVMPLNLQGKWNADPCPPWASDFHLNINLQMNYWPALRFGFDRANRAMLAFFERAIPNGRDAARRFFGTRGIWFSWAFDPACISNYNGGMWGVWTGVAAWLALHFYEEFEYTADLDFLRGHAFPFLRECALFYEDFITYAPDGSAVFSPTQSPENHFAGAEKYPISLCENATIDIELAGELLDDAVAASKILGEDEAERARWQSLRNRLPQLGIGRDGRLLEWKDEVAEVDPGHRHLSHLFGVWPGHSITPRKTPELYEAARKSLAFRLAHGGGHTGWSRAWCACFKAAFGDGDGALEELRALIGTQCSASLMDLHPYQSDKVFQIDGNFGAAAAMFAMLIRDADGAIELLPALPRAWAGSGSVERLRTRGALTLDFSWKNGQIEHLGVQAQKDAEVRFLIHGKPLQVAVHPGGKQIIF